MHYPARFCGIASFKLGLARSGIKENILMYGLPKTAGKANANKASETRIVSSLLLTTVSGYNDGTIYMQVTL